MQFLQPPHFQQDEEKIEKKKVKEDERPEKQTKAD